MTTHKKNNKLSKRKLIKKKSLKSKKKRSTNNIAKKTHKSYKNKNNVMKGGINIFIAVNEILQGDFAILKLSSAQMYDIKNYLKHEENKAKLEQYKTTINTVLSNENTSLLKPKLSEIAITNNDNVNKTTTGKGNTGNIDNPEIAELEREPNAEPENAELANAETINTGIENSGIANAVLVNETNTTVAEHNSSASINNEINEPDSTTSNTVDDDTLFRQIIGKCIIKSIIHNIFMQVKEEKSTNSNDIKLEIKNECNSINNKFSIEDSNIDFDFEVTINESILAQLCDGIFINMFMILKNKQTPTNNEQSKLFKDIVLKNNQSEINAEFFKTIHDGQKIVIKDNVIQITITNNVFSNINNIDVFKTIINSINTINTESQKQIRSNKSSVTLQHAKKTRTKQSVNNDKQIFYTNIMFIILDIINKVNTIVINNQHNAMHGGEYPHYSSIEDPFWEFVFKSICITVVGVVGLSTAILEAVSYPLAKPIARLFGKSLKPFALTRKFINIITGEDAKKKEAKNQNEEIQKYREEQLSDVDRRIKLIETIINNLNSNNKTENNKIYNNSMYILIAIYNSLIDKFCNILEYYYKIIKNIINVFHFNPGLCHTNNNERSTSHYWNAGTIESLNDKLEKCFFDEFYNICIADIDKFIKNANSVLNIIQFIQIIKDKPLQYLHINTLIGMLNDLKFINKTKLHRFYNLTVNEKINDKNTYDLYILKSKTNIYYTIYDVKQKINEKHISFNLDKSNDKIIYLNKIHYGYYIENNNDIYNAFLSHNVNITTIDTSTFVHKQFKDDINRALNLMSPHKLFNGDIFSFKNILNIFNEQIKIYFFIIVILINHINYLNYDYYFITSNDSINKYSIYTYYTNYKKYTHKILTNYERRNVSRIIYLVHAYIVNSTIYENDEIYYYLNDHILNLYKLKKNEIYDITHYNVFYKCNNKVEYNKSIKNFFKKYNNYPLFAYDSTENIIYSGELRYELSYLHENKRYYRDIKEIYETINKII